MTPRTDIAERRVAWRQAGAATLLLSASLLVFWPGVAMYDTVAQFGQVLSGEIEDWHPPVMVRLWQPLHAAFGGGTAPMFALQMGLYWLGLGLLAAALARAGRGMSGAAVLAMGLWPPFLGWQAVVLKDAQMAGALLAAVGVVARSRLAGHAPSWWGWGLVALLIGYATLVRGNAVFATVPLAVMLVPRWPAAARAGAIGAGMLAVLALSGPVNHRLLGATPTNIAGTQAIYDLSGIAVRAPVADVGLSAAQTRALIARRCVKPFFWDPLGDPRHCDAIVQPLRELPTGRLYAMLAAAALRHPLAYAAHRLEHLNSTERWWTPARWPSAAPPALAEFNWFGLTGPGFLGVAFERLAGSLVEIPPGWPIAWVAVALAAAAIAARRAAGPARDLALALLASALCLEASFAVLSIASDLRYHLWPMLASALAAALLWERVPGERGASRLAGAAVLVVVAVGCAARGTLPAPPLTYSAMLD